MQRREERTHEDQARLAEENVRRVADGLMPVKSVADIKASDEPDVILDQAVDVMADEVAGHVSGNNVPQVVRARTGVAAAPASQ